MLASCDMHGMQSGSSMYFKWLTLWKSHIPDEAPTSLALLLNPPTHRTPEVPGPRGGPGTGLGSPVRRLATRASGAIGTVWLV